jgi:uncharacterized membrane protein YczE
MDTAPPLSPVWRWGQFAAGIAVLGAGIALMVQAQIGLGPWGVLHQGISVRTEIPIGTVTILVGIVILLLWIPLGERPGPGTVLNTIFVGVLINFFMGIFPPLTPEIIAWPALWLAQLTQCASGVVLTSVGVALYIDAGMGAGPRDGVMMGLVRHSGRSIRLVRTLMELAALVTGWLLGGTAGIGTLLFAFGIGPIIQKTLHVLRQRRAVMQQHAQSCAGEA